MEVSFTLWSVKSILEEIPFDTPITGDAFHLDFSQLAVPHYVKNGFKVSIVYKDNSFPVDAVCSIYSPKNVVTVVIIMKRKYEESFRLWLDTHDDKYLPDCCRRRELYCHEIAHLIAIIRAYPSDRSSKVREDFLEKLRKKFNKSISNEKTLRAFPLISMEEADSSPAVFEKDHFRYDEDSLNYFKLFQELMLSYDRTVSAISKLSEKYRVTKSITFTDVAKETFATKGFLELFPEKLTELQGVLAEMLIK